MQRAELLEAWSELLRYPVHTGSAGVAARIGAVRTAVPDCADELEPLRSYSAEHEDWELEELFTRTFDSNAERALELTHDSGSHRGNRFDRR